MARYINKDELLNNFGGYNLTECVKFGNKNVNQRHTSYSTMMMYEIADIVDDAPECDAAPVNHGRWIIRKDTVYHYECSECKYLHQYNDKYCPNCGTKHDLSPMYKAEIGTIE